jgi:hypothetical protein
MDQMRPQRCDDDNREYTLRADGVITNFEDLEFEHSDEDGNSLDTIVQTTIHDDLILPILKILARSLFCRSSLTSFFFSQYIFGALRGRQ